MRIIIIVQSLIILVGAYYIYTLVYNDGAQSTAAEQDAPAQYSDPLVIDEPVAEDQIEESDYTIMTDSPITGPNDAGMEFPIPDDESLLEVR